MNNDIIQAATNIENTDAETAAPTLTHEASFLSLRRAKHADLLENILTHVDSLIYVQLSALYYLDCAFGLLLLRTLVQLFLLSARPPGLPQPPTRSALGAIIGSNIICIILHIVQARPSAGEASLSYLHGSILIDFVGQLGPTSKWRLIYHDTLLLFLQIVMQSMVIEKRRVQNAEKQTLEAEEAGVIRSDTFGDETRESDEGIEMQELIARESTAGEDTQGGTNTHVNTHPLDEFYTGNVTLARLNVGETIRRDVMSATTAIEDVQESAASGSVFLPGLFGLRWRTLQT